MNTLKAMLIAASFTLAGVTGSPAALTTRPHHVYLIGSLRVTQPWIDIGKGADDASGYLIVENRGSTPDRLIGADVAGAASVALVIGNTPNGTLAIPPRGTLTLKAGDAHLALHGLGGATPDGMPIEGTLHFERSGALHLSFARDSKDAIGDDQTTPSLQDKPVNIGQ